MISRNMEGVPGGYRPNPGTATGRVWEIADEITARKGSRASRKEVIDKFMAEGGNQNTAHTQFYLWKQHYESDVAPAVEQVFDVEAQRADVGSDGRLQIPAVMREAMMLGDSGHVTLAVKDGELYVISPAAAIRRAQRIAKSLKKPGESVVDEFLAERRALWGEE